MCPRRCFTERRCTSSPIFRVSSRVSMPGRGEDQPGPIRLTGLRTVFASPVAAAGRVYVTDRNGATIVLTHEDNPKALALNQLDDSFTASPAAVGRELLLRGERHLYSIAEE